MQFDSWYDFITQRYSGEEKKMAYVSSFTYCENIQTEMTPQGPRLQIITPLQVLKPVALPSNYSFAVACSIAGFDITKENKVQIIFVSPTNQTVNDTREIEFYMAGENADDSSSNAMQFNLDLRNVVLREKGIHTTRVFANGELIGEYKIEVTTGE
ncbi:MAG: hypothetical protein Q4A78_06085 [Peptostreptococcaceae bacterium]|nr:hypothetical protein [Peptostreptococcaceae bacterium]